MITSKCSDMDAPLRDPAKRARGRSSGAMFTLIRTGLSKPNRFCRLCRTLPDLAGFCTGARRNGVPHLQTGVAKSSGPNNDAKGQSCWPGGWIEGRTGLYASRDTQGELCDKPAIGAGRHL
jgi:hypothetical protein